MFSSGKLLICRSYHVRCGRLFGRPYDPQVNQTICSTSLRDYLLDAGCWGAIS